MNAVTQYSSNIEKNSLSRLDLKSNFGGSRDMLSTFGSRGNLSKDSKAKNKQNALIYKTKKQAEGEESEREPETSGALKWRWSKREDSEIHTIKYSNDNNYMAAGLGNGNIANQSCNYLFHALLSVFDPKTKNATIVDEIDADGSLRHWHARSGKLINTIQEPEPDIQLLHVSYSVGGDRFVSSGSDNNIRIYDGNKHQKIFSSKNSEEHGSIGHTNRIFCSKFHPKNSKLVISGGWDDTIQVWDIRSPNPVRRIFSPKICGDSLDFNEEGTVILAGSYKKSDMLQLWDFASGKLIENIPWSNDVNQPLSMVYSAQFSHKTNIDSSVKNDYILAGGSGAANEVKLFSTDTRKIVGSLNNMNCAIYCTAIASDDSHILVGGGGKMIVCLDVEENDVPPPQA